jgi:hypothetical protein
VFTVTARGLCPSSVAIKGSPRLTAFSQRGLHIPIPFRRDRPIIVGERDVAVVRSVALDEILYLTIDNPGDLHELSRAGILVSGMSLGKGGDSLQVSLIASSHV